MSLTDVLQTLILWLAAGVVVYAAIVAIAFLSVLFMDHRQSQ